MLESIWMFATDIRQAWIVCRFTAKAAKVLQDAATKRKSAGEARIEAGRQHEYGAGWSSKEAANLWLLTKCGLVQGH